MILLSFMARLPGYRRDGQKESSETAFWNEAEPVSSRWRWEPSTCPQDPLLRSFAWTQRTITNPSTLPRIQDRFLFLLFLRHQQPFCPPCRIYPPHHHAPEPFLSALAHCQCAIYLPTRFGFTSASSREQNSRSWLAPVNGATRGCEVRRVRI